MLGAFIRGSPGSVPAPTLATTLITTRSPYTPSTIFRLFAEVTLFCTLLAACGDGRGAASTRTLSVDGRGSSYLAIQDGAGTWRPLTGGAGAPYRVTLEDAEGRYGVLSLCLDTGVGNVSITVQHGVVAETPVVSATCLADPLGETHSVVGSVSGLSRGEYGNVYLGRASALVDSVTPSLRLEVPGMPEGAAAARYDLVASRYEGEAHVPSRLLLEPGLGLNPKSTLNLDFNGPFSFQPELAELVVDGLRPGELLSGSVELISGATAARVGEYAGGDVLVYARIPKSVERRLAQAWGGVAQRVGFRASIQSFSYNDRTKAGSSRSLSRTLLEPKQGAKSARLKLPAPIAPPRLRLRGDLYLRPRATWRLHPAGRGVYTQFYAQIQGGHTLSYRLSQSSAWLKGRASSYTLPDLNTLPDWQTTWNLTRGEALFWDVSFAQKTAVKELFVSRSGVVTP